MRASWGRRDRRGGTGARGAVVTDANGGEPDADGLLRLEVLAGNAAGFMIAVEDRLVIGRQAEGPGCLAGDPELSRHHAEISREATGQYVILDLSSTNGTFVNGERLAAPAVLGRGDRIGVGTTTLEVIEAPSTVDVHGETKIASLPPGLLDDQPPTEVEEATPTPQLELHITVDVDRAEVSITSSPDEEPIRLRLSDGSWKIDDGAS